MATFERIEHLSISSNPTDGALGLTSGGESFYTRLARRFVIPDTASDIRIRLRGCNIPWTSQNIVAGYNNKFYITYWDGVAVATEYEITIDPGLYSVEELNQVLKNAVEENGEDPASITISGFAATGKINIRLAKDMAVEFKALTPYALLGFTGGQRLPAAAYTTDITHFEAGAVATFSAVSHFMIHCDLVRYGIQRGTYQNIVAIVPIKVAPGSREVYQPTTLVEFNAPYLKGQEVAEFRSWITSQTNTALNMNSEYYDYDLEIVWQQ
jgi:hypothetical protein